MMQIETWLPGWSDDRAPAFRDDFRREQYGRHLVEAGLPR